MASNQFRHFPSNKITSGPKDNSLGSGKAPMGKEKPAFNASMPGKTQPKNRAGGTKKCRVYANSEGL